MESRRRTRLALCRITSKENDPRVLEHSRVIVTRAVTSRTGRER